MGCASAKPGAADHTPRAIGGGRTAKTTTGSWTAPCTCRAEGPKDYSFSCELGKGAFGVVYAATERAADAEVAVKVVDMGGKSECRRQRAKAEVELWRTIGAHPNIVGLRGSFMEKHFMFIVMERCQGDVLHVLRRGGCPGRRLPMRPMLLGIQACHQAMIVHRDIKPENFLVGQDGASVKLCDFGLAARLPPKGGLRGQTGTAPMMSPEMLEGKEYGTGTDVWSFAAMAYLLVFKELPYIPKEMTAKEAKKAVMKGKPPRRIQGVMDVREKTEAAFLASLLQREPGRRPSVGKALEHPLLLQAPDPWMERQPPAFQTKGTNDTLAPLDDDILQDDDDSQGEWGATSPASTTHSNRCLSGSASPRL